MEAWKDDLEDDQDSEFDEGLFGGKNALLFLIDVSSPEMHEKVPDQSEGIDDTRLQLALKCVHATLRRKILGSPNDVVGVILFGTERNVNVKDFEHLSMILPMDVSEGTSIQLIEKYIEDPSKLKEDVGAFENCQVKIHEALWQCQSVFNDVSGKVAGKKILLFTTKEDPHANDSTLRKQALKKGRDLIETEIELEVVPFTRSFDFSKFYSKLTMDIEELQSLHDNSNLSDNSQCLKLQDLMSMVRKKVYTKRSMGRCHFDLGNGVKLAISTYNFVQRASKPSKVWLTRDKNEEVKISRQFLDSNTGSPLLPSEIARFMEYGNKKLKFSQDEVRAMQKTLLDGEFGLKLICFKKLEGFKWSLFVKSSHFIYPDELSITGSRTLFAALHCKCLERKVVAICSYKSRQVSMPSFVALIPLKEETNPSDGTQKTPPGFLLFYLPFVDDLRGVPDPIPLPKTRPEQEEAAGKVIKKLKMKVYEVEQFDNPGLQAHYRMIEELALFKADEEDPGDTTMPNFDLQGQRLGDKSQLFNDAMRPSPELEAEIEAALAEKKAQKRPYFGYADQAAISKKPKVGGDEAVDSGNMEKLVNSKKVESLNVAELKAFLKSIGSAVSNKRKGQLVQEIYDHFDAVL